ncbi:HupE/UreJ family protein [Leifsonia aquatica]|uniref:HupE/UreJ family protein n=1 Tax=Leifsonia aquatica TaxID=144185 RepID=UPI0037F97910
MRRGIMVASAALLAGAAVLLGASPASAHVVPSTTIELDVHEADITAALTLPKEDLVAASGIDLTGTGPVGASAARAVLSYLEKHFAVTTGTDHWTVDVADVAETDTEQWGTGTFGAITATATLTPAAASDLRSFTLDYDAIIHQVESADIYVILHSDWATGQVEAARTLGAIQVDTVTGTVPPLTVDLEDGSPWNGFVGMLTLGIGHIAEGTDHQLFLLTLLLPAPLLAVGRRWKEVAPARSAVRRITAITIAFTIGHSITLALGALGLPVPQQPVEALIAVSILIAAAHAIRPLFPGREPLIAGVFGLIHGMAFSATLSALDLSGGQLVLSLLGFNLGIEVMQLVVVLLVLPPLVLLARTRSYTPLRVTAAALTAAAATGWLLARIGVPNVVGAAADTLGLASPCIVIGLWAAAITAYIIERSARGDRGSRSAVTNSAAPTGTAVVVSQRPSENM